MKNKSLKKVMIVFLAIILLLGLLAFVYMLPMLSMKPADTGKIADTPVYSVKDSINNVNVIPLSDGYLMIDAGSNLEGLASALREINIKPEEIKHLFLTHTDTDHVAALELFAHASIYIGSEEMQMIDGRTPRFLFITNSISPKIDQNQMILLHDMEEIKIENFVIQAIHTPGHTMGSTTFFINQKYLFTGDAFKVKDNVMQLHPYSMDSSLSKQSIGKIATYLNDGVLVFTSHYGYYPATALSAT